MGPGSKKTLNYLQYFSVLLPTCLFSKIFFHFFSSVSHQIPFYMWTEASPQHCNLLPFLYKSRQQKNSFSLLLLFFFYPTKINATRTGHLFPGCCWQTCLRAGVFFLFHSLTLCWQSFMNLHSQTVLSHSLLSQNLFQELWTDLSLSTTERPVYVFIWGFFFLIKLLTRAFDTYTI